MKCLKVKFEELWNTQLLQKTNLSLTIQIRAADNTFQRKKLKYQTLCDANNLEFRPLIIESTGKFHPQCKKFFEKGIKLMTAGAHPYVVSITRHYWSLRFSCCIQKCIADAFFYHAANGYHLQSSASMGPQSTRFHQHSYDFSAHPSPL